MTVSDTVTPFHQIYISLMDEIKGRCEATQIAIGGQQPPFRERVVWELCHLQLRMICELIALACLAAHNEITTAQKGKLIGTFSPGEIMRRLEELHPDFYPKPAAEKIGPSGGLDVVPFVGEYLTKQDLLKLYSDCGDVLHRGSFKNLLKRSAPPVQIEKVDRYRR